MLSCRRTSIAPGRPSSTTLTLPAEAFGQQSMARIFCPLALAAFVTIVHTDVLQLMHTSDTNSSQRFVAYLLLCSTRHYPQKIAIQPSRMARSRSSGCRWTSRDQAVIDTSGDLGWVFRQVQARTDERRGHPKETVLADTTGLQATPLGQVGQAASLQLHAFDRLFLSCDDVGEARGRRRGRYCRSGSEWRGRVSNVEDDGRYRMSPPTHQIRWTPALRPRSVSAYAESGQPGCPSLPRSWHCCCRVLSQRWLSPLRPARGWRAGSACS